MAEMQTDENPRKRFEIFEAIRSMKDKRAKGMDGVKLELLKEGMESILEEI